MIALKDGLPLLELNEGRIVILERKWLFSFLLQAAKKAGYPNWWVAEDVTESTLLYLQLLFNENVIPLPLLARAVRSALRDLGYAEVARHFKPTPPPPKVSLLEIAREAGTGYELAFFNQLGHALRTMLTAKSKRLEIIDLKPCVKQLRSKKTWSRDCEILRAEIVSFARDQICLNHSGREINLSLT